MDYIVTKNDYTPKTPQELKDNDIYTAAKSRTLYDLLKASDNGSMDFKKVTIHKWFWDKDRWEVNSDYVIFDFDPMDEGVTIEDSLDEIVVALNKVIGVHRDNLTIIFTGRGYHILIRTLYKIDRKFLSDTKKSYEKICSDIEIDLPGIVVDPIFPKWNVKTRLPGRNNEKNNNPVKLIQLAGPDQLYAVDFLRKNTPKENKQTLKELIITDSDRVLSECEFIKTSKARNLNYSEWMAMLSNVARLADGTYLAHQYSKVDDRYSEKETIEKIIEVKKLAEPYSCSTISGIWGGCEKCVHYRKIKNPTELGIKKQEAIFRLKDENGNLLKGNPINIIEAAKELSELWIRAYDPAKRADKINKLDVFCYSDSSGYWKRGGLFWAKNFVSKMINDDCDLVYGGGNKGPTQEKILNEWFTEYQEKVSVGPENINPNGLYNFPNGVYNAKTGKFEEKNDECIFTYVMPYKYDPNADCPQVRKRIDEWMEGAEHQTETLLGYVGLGAMGIATSTEKFCLLSGKTRNGKSMFLDMIRGTLGVENISGLSLSNITDPQMSSNLIGKALNLCDESGKNDTEGPTRFSRGYTKTTDWDALKLVISGQPIVCNEKHKHPYEFVNKAAIIISANEIPKSFGPDDKAIRSRLLHVRFRNDFGPDSGRMVPKQKLYKEFEAERPGIFNLIMEHGKMAQRNGLKISDKMKQSIESITDHVDTFKLFIEDCVELGDLNTKNKDLLKSKDIYKHYTDWYLDELGGEREFMLKTHISFSKHLCAYLRNNDLEEYFKIVDKQQRFFLALGPWEQEGDDEYSPPPF